MHTFCQIIHKSTTETNELYHFATSQKLNSSNIYEFNTIACSNEYRSNKNIPLIRDMNNRLIKIFFHIYAIGPIDYSIKSKFSYFKKTIDNIFISDELRKEFILTFSNIQRYYWSLNRAAFHYKMRKSKFQVKTDLILNPISETQYNVMTIMQNNTKYLFTVLDLKNIIESALSNSPYFFSTPLSIKNPYNNMPFDKSTLYNIYFFMKRGNFVLSNLFHNYFLLFY
jgi:hypothetical protein